MKRSRLNPISKDPKRREKRFVPANVLKAVNERSSGLCERILKNEYSTDHGFTVKCWKAAMPQPHHILPRSQGGKHTVDNLLDLCFDCHRWAHDNQTKAKAEGILK